MEDTGGMPATPWPRPAVAATSNPAAGGARQRRTRPRCQAIPRRAEAHPTVGTYEGIGGSAGLNPW